MKNISLTFLIFLFSMLCNNISAQQVVSEKFSPSEYVYWFYLRAESKIDKELNSIVYRVRTLSKTPKYGTFNAYQKDTWRCLQGGQQLVIGPFRELNVAKQSILIYDLAKLSDALRTKEIERLKDSSEMMASTCYFYYLKFSVSQRTHRFILKRVPAAINEEGMTISDFMDGFLAGLTQEMLAIGPFFSKPEAEESKGQNRLEEY
jgi:hypothetical protein